MIPLSFAQAEVSDRPVPFAVRLRGRLAPAALWSAVLDVVGRHEILRTTFPVIDGVRCQLVVDLPPELIEVSCQEPELAAELDRVAHEKFDLASQLPIRAWLFELGPEEHVLLVVLHHIAADPWSTGPLLRDLTTAYEARLRGSTPDWPPLLVQYADYTWWQHDVLGGGELDRQLQYWADALAGLPAELSLPFDRPKPPVASGLASALPVWIDAGTHRGLVELARSSRVTLFMAVRAGIAVLLSRMGAGTDIPLGTVVSGRTDEVLDDVIGLFANTLVLRTDLSGDPTFRDLLARVRAIDLAAFANQDVPFGRLAADRRLVPVMMVLRHNTEPVPEFPGVTAEVEPIGTDVTEFDLSLDLTEFHEDTGAAAGIGGTIVFPPELFEHDTVEALARRFVRVLGQVVADPDLPIGQLDLLEADEPHLLA